MSGGVFILIVIAFFFVWLLLIRPQRRRQTEQLTMQDTIDVGDEIVTAGGLYGTVTSLDEDEVAVEIADGVVVRLARRAVAGVLPPDEEADQAEPEEPADPASEPERQAEAKLEPR
jgi:preprotein translocase subunit YajC